MRYRDERGWEYVVIDGEKLYTDPMRDVVRTSMPDLPLPRRPSWPMAAHAAAIQAMDDSPERERLIDLYHARNAVRVGRFAANWYRKEYEWLRANPSMAEVIPFRPRR